MEDVAKFLVGSLEAMVNAATSMEQRHLTIISLLDAAETIAVGGLRGEQVDPHLVAEISQLKQRAIEAFADMNQTHTVDVVMERVQDALAGETDEADES